MCEINVILVTELAAAQQGLRAFRRAHLVLAQTATAALSGLGRPITVPYMSETSDCTLQ